MAIDHDRHKTSCFPRLPFKSFPSWLKFSSKPPTEPPMPYSVTHKTLPSLEDKHTPHTFMWNLIRRQWLSCQWSQGKKPLVQDAEGPPNNSSCPTTEGVWCDRQAGVELIGGYMIVSGVMGRISVQGSSHPKTHYSSTFTVAVFLLRSSQCIIQHLSHLLPALFFYLTTLRSSSVGGWTKGSWYFMWNHYLPAMNYSKFSIL